MKISQQALNALDSSVLEAEKRHHEFVTPEHLLFVFLETEEIKNLLTVCGADFDYLKSSVEDYLQKHIPQIREGSPVQSGGFHNVLQRSMLHCVSADKKVIELTDLLVSLFDETKNHSSFYLRKAGVQRITLLDAIIESNNDALLNENLENSFTVEEPENDVTKGKNSSKKQKKSVLERFTTDLTQKAKNGELDVLVGRAEELERTIQILCRRTKNNPLHVGESGVGKTALTYGLAQKIASGDVPEVIKDFVVLSLDMGQLVAGTKFRGDFEERIKRISDEIVKKGKVILLIDEIHTIVGTGTVSSSSLDAANLLKPLLTSGKARCIGTTTYDEYNKFFSKDKALLRRFQKIDIEEPSDEESFLILKGLQSRYEEYHSVVYTDEAFKNAITLARSFIPERKLPDKAIDIIDEAGSYLRLHPDKGAVVDKKLIDFITSKIARIPEKSVTISEKDRLKTLEPMLSKAVFGQNNAVNSVVNAVKRARSGFRSSEKTVANFLFVGPTGVGKTELAKTLSKELGVKLLRFDMSEYQEKHTVSRLIGSPPGYVGFEEGGLLTDAVRKDPQAVVLLDEIEKAHSDIFNILLQVMDYATLTDNQGRKADFRNVILIMTSNAGASNINKSIIGFGEKTQDESAIDDAVEKTFTPEFRNRLDAIILFNYLDPAVMISIVRKEFDRLNNRLAEKNIEIKPSDSCVEYLASISYSKEYGARNVERIIDEKISTILIDEVLFGALQNGGVAFCDLKDEKIVFSYE